jgi:hypothetical protein
LQFIDKTGFLPAAFRLPAFACSLMFQDTDWCAKCRRINSQLELWISFPQIDEIMVSILMKLVIIWGPILLYCHFKNKSLQEKRPSNISHTIYTNRGQSRARIVRIYITKGCCFCVLKNPYLDSFIWVPMRDIFSAVVKNSEAQSVGSSCQVEGTVVLYSAVWLSGLLLTEIWHCEKQWSLMEALFILRNRRYLNVAPPMFQY